MGGGKGRPAKRINVHSPRAQYHQRSPQYGGGKPNYGKPRSKPQRSFLDDLFNPKKGKRR